MADAREADRARTTEIDIEIHELEDRIHLLRVERDAIQEHLQAYKYPVLTLPAEITSEIFLQFIPPYPDPPPTSGNLSPNLLTHICRQWRHISFSIPTLWRAISLYIEHPDNREANIVKSWLARSGSCPLSIRLIGEYHLPLLECILAIIPHRARWEYLHVSGPDPDDITLLAGPTPLLRQLKLYTEGLFSHPIAFDEAPLLRSCNLDVNVVTPLPLARTFRSEWFPILRHTENLVHFAGAIYSGGSSDIHSDLTLRRLESLVLMMVYETDDDPGTDYLDMLTLPALRRLQVADSCLGTDHIGSLTSLISRSGCKLEQMCITGPRSVSRDSYRQSFPFISFNATLRGWYDYVIDVSGDSQPDEADSNAESELDDPYVLNNSHSSHGRDASWQNLYFNFGNCNFCIVAESESKQFDNLWSTLSIPSTTCLPSLYCKAQLRLAISTPFHTAVAHISVPTAPPGSQNVVIDVSVPDLFWAGPWETAQSSCFSDSNSKGALGNSLSADGGTIIFSFEGTPAHIIHIWHKWVSVPS
ncbi:hypothetical protein C8R43DRAFT_941395 [Mycena crocata]|nr:hypothetical protein C8R43DRAFT_941395 [Mycena crocata]